METFLNEIENAVLDTMSKGSIILYIFALGTFVIGYIFVSLVEKILDIIYDRFMLKVKHYRIYKVLITIELIISITFVVYSIVILVGLTRLIGG